MYKKNINWFSRALIIALCIFIVVIVTLNFWFNDKTITTEILVSLAFLIVISLSEVFDNFSIGKLLTLRKNYETERQQKEQLSIYNRELQQNLLNIMNVKNSNTTNFITYDGKNIKTVEPANEKDILDKAEEVLVKDEEEKGHTKSEMTFLERRELLAKLEKESISKYCENYNIQNFIKDVKLNEGNQTDPIINKSVIFDGYYTIGSGEFFIETATSSRLIGSLTQMDLYYKLSKLFYYRNYKNSPVKLVFLIIHIQDDRNESNLKRVKALNELFSPAIENGLLEIVVQDFPEDIIKNSK